MEEQIEVEILGDGELLTELLADLDAITGMIERARGCCQRQSRCSFDSARQNPVD